MPAPVSTEAISEAQLKRKRVQKEKASIVQASKRQKSSHADSITTGHTSPGTAKPTVALPATASPVQKNGVAPTSTPKSEEKRKRKSLQSQPNVANASKSQQKAQDAPKVGGSADIGMPDETDSFEKRAGKTRRSRRKTKENSNQVDLVDSTQAMQSGVAKSQSASTWSISTSVGGRYISHDPIFSNDER